MGTQEFKKKEEEKTLPPEKTIYDLGGKIINPETTFEKLIELTKIAGTTQVYRNLLEATKGVERLSRLIANLEKLPSAPEIANNFVYSIKDLGEKTEGKA